MERERRGACSAHVVRADRTEFRYLGLDKVSRRTVLQFQPTPARLDAHRATFEIELAPQEQTSLFVTVACEEEQTVEPGDFFLVYRETRRARRTSTLGVATVSSSNEVFNEVVCRAHVRPLHADHAHRARAISLRRDSLVQHSLRPRRHHYGHVDAVDGPVRGARRAALACRHPSDGYSPGGGCAAGQDPARAPSRRDGASRRGAVPVLLRNGGRDAALPHARRHVFRTHRRSRDLGRDLAEYRGRPALDRRIRRPRRRRLRRVLPRDRAGSCQQGLEGLARFHLPRRRVGRRGADRPVRGAGLRLCRQALHRHASLLRWATMC